MKIVVLGLLLLVVYSKTHPLQEGFLLQSKYWNWILSVNPRLSFNLTILLFTPVRFVVYAYFYFSLFNSIALFRLFIEEDEQTWNENDNDVPGELS